MTTEEEIVTETFIARAAANEEMLAEMQKRAAVEAKIAEEQDAALQAVRDECDAFRAKLASN